MEPERWRRRPRLKPSGGDRLGHPRVGSRELDEVTDRLPRRATAGISCAISAWRHFEIPQSNRNIAPEASWLGRCLTRCSKEPPCSCPVPPSSRFFSWPPRPPRPPTSQDALPPGQANRRVMFPALVTAAAEVPEAPEGPRGAAAAAAGPAVEWRVAARVVAARVGRAAAARAAARAAAVRAAEGA
jgi:hypothetical protein